jgi:hypothetical protein
MFNVDVPKGGATGAALALLYHLVEKGRYDTASTESMLDDFKKIHQAIVEARELDQQAEKKK